MDYIAYGADNSYPLGCFPYFYMIYGNRVLSQECKSRFKKTNLCVRELRFKLGLYGLDKTQIKKLCIARAWICISES